jgi:hypothetical protein
MGPVLGIAFLHTSLAWLLSCFGRDSGDREGVSHTYLHVLYMAWRSVGAFVRLYTYRLFLSDALSARALGVGRGGKWARREKKREKIAARKELYILLMNTFAHIA